MSCMPTSEVVCETNRECVRMPQRSTSLRIPCLVGLPQHSDRQGLIHLSHRSRRITAGTVWMEMKSAGSGLILLSVFRTSSVLHYAHLPASSHNPRSNTTSHVRLSLALVFLCKTGPAHADRQQTTVDLRAAFFVRHPVCACHGHQCVPY